MKRDPLHNHSRSAKDKGVEPNNEFPRAKRLEKKRRVQKIRAATESGYADAQDIPVQTDDTQDDLRSHVQSRATPRDEQSTEN